MGQKKGCEEVSKRGPASEKKQERGKTGQKTHKLDCSLPLSSRRRRQNPGRSRRRTRRRRRGCRGLLRVKNSVFLERSRLRYSRCILISLCPFFNHQLLLSTTHERALRRRRAHPTCRRRSSGDPSRGRRPRRRPRQARGGAMKRGSPSSFFDARSEPLFFFSLVFSDSRFCSRLGR